MASSRKLLIDQPLKNLTHDFRFRFVDDELTGSGLPARQAGVAVGRLSDREAALARAIETTAATALSNLSAFVFGKDAGHFEQHPFTRGLPQALMKKANLATCALKLLND